MVVSRDKAPASFHAFIKGMPSEWLVVPDRVAYKPQTKRSRRQQQLKQQQQQQQQQRMRHRGTTAAASTTTATATSASASHNDDDDDDDDDDDGDVFVYGGRTGGGVGGGGGGGGGGGEPVMIDLREKLAVQLGIEGAKLPVCLLVDPGSGEVVCSDVGAAVAEDPAGAGFVLNCLLVVVVVCCCWCWCCCCCFCFCCCLLFVAAGVFHNCSHRGYIHTYMHACMQQ